jgi:hypothetical protein
MAYKETRPHKGKLTGKKFHYWTVLKKLPYDKPGAKEKYQCRCKCGTEKAVQKSNLVRGATKSCGCRPFVVKRRTARFTPRFFGNFYIESIHSWKRYAKGSAPIYNVKCACGKKVKIIGSNYKFQVGCSKNCPLSPLSL